MPGPVTHRNVNRVNTCRCWGFPDLRTKCLSQIQVSLKWSSWTGLRTLEIKYGSGGDEGGFIAGLRDAFEHLYGCPASQRAGASSIKSIPWLLDWTRRSLSSPALQLLCRGWGNSPSKTLGLSWKNENILGCGKEGVSKQKPGVSEQKAESADDKQPGLSCSSPSIHVFHFLSPGKGLPAR